MAVQFGVSVPQGWTMDLVEIADPEEKYEAMTRTGYDLSQMQRVASQVIPHFRQS